MQPVDRALADLAKRQHGIAARSQVLGLGVAGNTVDRWIRSGRLHRLHPGVYAVGHTAITRRGTWMAAVLASGSGGVLSHRTATALFGIWGSGTGELHVTVPWKGRSTRSIHRHFSVLPDDEREIVDGVPVTSAARAVLDLAGEKGEAAAESALREMEYLGIYGKVSLPMLLERYPRHRGAAIVEVCLERLRDDPGGRVRSDLEERFLAFLDAHRIPRPRLNFWLSVDDETYQVDCLWPEARLIAELDDWKSHGTRRAFGKDRKRDRHLGRAGYRVVRITGDQIRTEPSQLAADLQASVITYAAWQR
jgi:very-short-patch-repair endonuclease